MIFLCLKSNFYQQVQGSQSLNNSGVFVAVPESVARVKFHSTSFPWHKNQDNEIVTTSSITGTRRQTSVFQPVGDPRHINSPDLSNGNSFQSRRTIKQAWVKEESVNSRNIDLGNRNQSPKRRGALCEEIEKKMCLVKMNGARMSLYDLRMELLRLPQKVKIRLRKQI